MPKKLIHDFNDLKHRTSSNFFSNEIDHVIEDHFLLQISHNVIAYHQISLKIHADN